MLGLNSVVEPRLQKAVIPMEIKVILVWLNSKKRLARMQTIFLLAEILNYILIITI